MNRTYPASAIGDALKTGAVVSRAIVKGSLEFEPYQQ